MSAWIELHQSFPRHRKVVSAGHRLDVPRMSMMGHMICLWTWAVDNAPEGYLDGVSNAVIATAAEWTGDSDQFVDVLVEVGFLDRHSDRLQIHNWDVYAGKLIERRKADRERKRIQRTSKRLPKDIGTMSAGHPEDVRKVSQAVTLSPLTLPPHTPLSPIPSDPNRYIHILEEIEGWKGRGKPYVDSLLVWQKQKGITDDQMERSAIGLSKCQQKTLRGYANLVRALQNRINMGYDDPSRNQSHATTRPNSALLHATPREVYKPPRDADGKLTLGR